MNDQHKLSNYLLLVLAAFLFGVKAIFDKQVALHSDSNIFATAVSSGFSAIIVVVALYLKDRNLHFKKATNLEWLQMFGVGSIASGLVIYFTFLGLEESSATFAALNQGVAALSTVLVAGIWLKERLPRIFALVLPLMIAGTYLVSVGGFVISPMKKGDIIILSAAVLIGFSNVLARKAMHTVSSQQVTIMRFVFGGLTAFLLALLTRETLALDGLMWMMLSGVAGGFFVLLLYEGIRRIGAGIASSIIMFSPVFAAILAVPVYHDLLNPVQLLGMALVIAGGVLISKAWKPIKEATAQ